jgi:hypothetical protein
MIGARSVVGDGPERRGGGGAWGLPDARARPTTSLCPPPAKKKKKIHVHNGDIYKSVKKAGCMVMVRTRQRRYPAFISEEESAKARLSSPLYGYFGGRKEKTKRENQENCRL